MVPKMMKFILSLLQVFCFYAWRIVMHISFPWIRRREKRCRWTSMLLVELVDYVTYLSRGRDGCKKTEIENVQCKVM